MVGGAPGPLSCQVACFPYLRPTPPHTRVLRSWHSQESILFSEHPSPFEMVGNEKIENRLFSSKPPFCNFFLLPLSCPPLFFYILSCANT